MFKKTETLNVASEQITRSIVTEDNDHSFSLFDDAEQIVFNKSNEEVAEWIDEESYGNGLLWTRTISCKNASLVLVIERCCPSCESTSIRMENGNFDKMYCGECGEAYERLHSHR